MDILIVDDDRTCAAKMAESSPEDTVVMVHNLREAGSALRKEEFWPEVVVLDAVFPEGPLLSRYAVVEFKADRFLDLLEEVRQERGLEPPDVLLVSGQDEAAQRFDEVAGWLEAGRIRDILPKSAANAGWGFFQSVLAHKIDACRRARELRGATRAAGDAFESLRMHGIVTKDPRMVQVWEVLAAAAVSGCNVFIQGATGTGKELVARAIAKLRNQKFLAVNCAAFPPDLFESELFGYARGAHATALSDRDGKIRAAGKGVLFLDEINSIAPQHQPKLLRVVDRQREYSRLGEDVVHKAQCMFVSAGQTSLFESAAAGAFRGDLAYRLAATRIVLPPLCERRGDVPLLIDHFLRQFNQQYQKQVRLAPEVVSWFEKASWPGNVRQLENYLEQLVQHPRYTGLVTIQNARQVLAEQDLCLPAGGSPPNVLPSSDDEVLTQLSTELEYKQPATWQELLASSQREEKEQRVLTLLKRCLNVKGSATLKGLDEALHARERDNPSRILIYAIMLYMVLSKEQERDLEDLARISGYASLTQPHKAADLLREAGFLHGEKKARNKHVYQLRKDLLREALDAIYDEGAGI
jgi:DNA-binding NtrC family response regulator